MSDSQAADIEGLEVELEAERVRANHNYNVYCIERQAAEELRAQLITANLEVNRISGLHIDELNKNVKLREQLTLRRSDTNRIDEYPPLSEAGRKAAADELAADKPEPEAVDTDWFSGKILSMNGLADELQASHLETNRISGLHINQLAKVRLLEQRVSELEDEQSDGWQKEIEGVEYWRDAYNKKCQQRAEDIGQRKGLQAQITTLHEHIENAPHGDDCITTMYNNRECDCWKSNAKGEW